MWAFLAKTPERHFIDHGRVACPLRGRDVEADLCVGCRWIVEVREDGAPPYIRCQPGLQAIFAR